jgi:hypothetical protein
MASLHPRFILFTAWAVLCLPAAVEAKQSQLTPAQIKQINKTHNSFETCRKDAIELLKQGKVSKKKFEIALNACKDNFPGSDLYITCKKQAIQTASSKNIAPDQLVEQCKRYLLATSFDPTNPLPYFSEAGQLYFAGIGLNRSLPTAALTPQNFNCENVAKLIRTPRQAQYLLFGNHPQTFAGLTEVKSADIDQFLKLRKPSTTGTDVDGFGRVFRDPATPDATVFFPAAACDFDAQPGDIFAGLSAYYLLDRSGSSVTPYFGIAYYHRDQRRINTSKLIQGLIRTLGPEYKTFNKNKNVTFIAAASLPERDEEQDPKNLCRQPRQHRFIGVVQGFKDKPTLPEYAMIVNIKNLCDFGDRLAKRLLQ